ncbi:MAG: class I SAM-dependent methyltransferase [Rhodobacteraceae bacterium]|nr:class I SAM-dependent methyltransferase [Paracoccaceae bacterium]
MTKMDLCIDFTSGAVAHRLRFGGGRGQDLPKAIGLKKGANPHVVDATAGLGRDAFLLASLGARVTLIERSEPLHALLAAALAKAQEGEMAEIISRMELRFGDAKDLLPTLSPEVVLVDPMHPPRGNSALVKQEMRQLREIVGEDPDAVALINVALASATKRVVLKWPRKAALPAGLPAPSHQILGKSTRYDVWMR